MSINSFLRKIASDIKNTAKEFSAEDFYYILKYVGVKPNISLVSDITQFYHDFLDNLNNSLVKYEVKQLGHGDNITHYIALYADSKAKYRDAVKVYFPVKYDYLISSLKTIFLYLIRNNIMATVKFHVKATNEGIVIRFYDKKDVLPFVNYCNNNFVLKDLLVGVNPFIATIYGIGIVFDDNTVSTYNKTLSLLLEEYFKYMSDNNLLDKVSDLDFLDFIMKRVKLEKNEIRQYNMEAIINNFTAILNHNSPISESEK